jgi:hypothetical protein
VGGLRCCLSQHVFLLGLVLVGLSLQQEGSHPSWTQLRAREHTAGFRPSTCFEIGGAVRGVHGPSWATRGGEARAGCTCEPSRGDPAPCPGTHSGRADLFETGSENDKEAPPHGGVTRPLFAACAAYCGCCVTVGAALLRVLLTPTAPSLHQSFHPLSQHTRGTTNRPREKNHHTLPSHKSV